MKKPDRMTSFHAADRDTGAATVFDVPNIAYVEWLEQQLELAASLERIEQPAIISRNFLVQNYRRALRWHNGDLSNWSPAEWGNAIAGEVGEFCNIAKKILRASEKMQQRAVDTATLTEKAAEELADVVTYCVVTALAMDIDLNAALRNKFNSISEREGFPERV